MKYLLNVRVLAMFVLTCGAGSFLRAALTWSGVSPGSWTDGSSDNWGAGVGVYPGDAANPGVGITLPDGSEVTLSTPLPNAIGNAFVELNTLASATLNVQASLTNNGFFGIGNWDSSTINHSAGTFTQTARFDLGRSGGNGTSSLVTTMALTGSAIFNMTNNDFRFGYTSGGINRAYLTATDTAQISAPQLVQWGQGTVEVSGDATLAFTGNATMTATSVLNVTGNGTVEVGGILSNSAGGAINLTGGRLSVGRMVHDASSPFTVSSGATFQLQDFAVHNFADGLLVNGGGMLDAGPGNTLYNVDITGVTAGTGGDLTFADGAQWNLALNGDTMLSDTWTVDTLTLSAFTTVNLVVDVVAGDTLPTDYFDILSYSSLAVVGGSFSDVTFTISGAEGTRLTGGTVTDTGSGLRLSNLTAFAIPEPSSFMLLLSALAMFRLTYTKRRF